MGTRFSLAKAEFSEVMLHSGVLVGNKSSEVVQISRKRALVLFSGHFYRS